MRNTEAAEGSNAPQRRTKTTATKEKEPTMGMDEIPLAEFISRRKINPYGNPRANFRGNELFWTKQQNLIYLDVIKAKQNTHVEVKWINMHHMRKEAHREYFGEALDLVEQFGIEHIISFHKDYDPEILAQFFASVHFHPNEERTMTWMTNGRQLTATWKEFMTLLGVPDEGLATPQGVRPHANPESANKNKLMPYYVEKRLSNGKSSWVLNSFLDIMHRIFRNTLFPRIGDKDKVHAYLVDMMLLCEDARNSQTLPLDVSHIMWHELRFAVYNRKVPIYGPYLFQLISATWERVYPQDEFEAPGWIRHEPINLRIKPQWANTTSRADTAAAMDVDADEDEEEAADEDSSEGYIPPTSEPSWAKRLKNKMKMLFCMQAKGQYQTHVASKETRRRDKRIFRTFGENISSGSEVNITPEAEWMHKQGYRWTESEEESIPAAESDGERASDYSA